MVVDIVVISDLGSSAEFSATAKFYLPANLRILLTMLRYGDNFGYKQEHFPEDDLTWISVGHAMLDL